FKLCPCYFIRVGGAPFREVSAKTPAYGGNGAGFHAEVLHEGGLKNGPAKEKGRLCRRIQFAPSRLLRVADSYDDPWGAHQCGVRFHPHAAATHPRRVARVDRGSVRSGAAPIPSGRVSGV